MSPDERQHMSDIVSLREYIEALFEQYQRHHAREHELLAQNIDRAQAVAEERLGHLNRLKEQNLQERSDFVTRDLFDARLADIEKSGGAAHGAEDVRIKMLETALANLRGRMTATAAAISVGLVILQLVLRFVVKL